MKYAHATMWIFCGWLLRRLHMPERWVHEVEDQALMRMFLCWKDFERVESVQPAGWRCQHMTITAGGSGTIRDVSCFYGCQMQPHYGTRVA